MGNVHGRRRRKTLLLVALLAGLAVVVLNDFGSEPARPPDPAALPTSTPSRGEVERQALVSRAAAAIQDVAPQLLKMTNHPRHVPVGTSCGLSKRLSSVYVCTLESRTPRGRMAAPIPLAATRWRNGVNVVPITEAAADACRSTLNCPFSGSGIFVSLDN